MFPLITFETKAKGKIILHFMSWKCVNFRKNVLFQTPPILGESNPAPAEFSSNPNETHLNQLIKGLTRHTRNSQAVGDKLCSTLAFQDWDWRTRLQMSKWSTETFLWLFREKIRSFESVENSTIWWLVKNKAVKICEGSSVGWSSHHTFHGSIMLQIKA